MEPPSYQAQPRKRFGAKDVIALVGGVKSRFLK
jgi:hypothetical protein